MKMQPKLGTGGESLSSNNALKYMLQPVTQINDFAELDAHRAAWAHLLGKTPGADFFRTYDWLKVYWRHFQGDQQLRALIIGDPSDPLGILPFVLRRESIRLGTVRVLTWPLDDWGAFYGPIGSHPAALLEAGLRYLHQAPRDWDLLELRCSPSGSGARAETIAAMQAGGFTPATREWAQSARVEMKSSWENYWMSRTSKWRNNVRRSEKKLTARGELRFERFRPEASDESPQTRYDLYDACIAVASNSWQAASSTGTTITHGQVKDFLRDAHQTAAACGAVDLNLLWCAEQPIAFAYNYVWQGRVFGLRQGYDPSAAKDGAGTVLMRYMLEDSCARGDVEFDLGVDYLHCKRYWWTTIAPSLCHTHYALTPKAQALRLKRWFNKAEPEKAGK